MSWPENYINKKFDNCWELVREIYLNELEIKLPLVLDVYPDILKIVRTLDVSEYKADWKQITKPVEYSVLGLSQSNHIHHVGVWTEVDGGKLIHTYESSPVTAQDIIQLTRHGFKKIEFYEYSPS